MPRGPLPPWDPVRQGPAGRLVACEDDGLGEVRSRIHGVVSCASNGLGRGALRLLHFQSRSVACLLRRAVNALERVPKGDEGRIGAPGLVRVRPYGREQKRTAHVFRGCIDRDAKSGRCCT